MSSVAKSLQQTRGSVMRFLTRGYSFCKSTFAPGSTWSCCNASPSRRWRSSKALRANETCGRLYRLCAVWHAKTHGVVPSNVWQFAAFEMKNFKICSAPQLAVPGLIASKQAKLVHYQHVSEKCARNDPFRVGSVQTRARAQ